MKGNRKILVGRITETEIKRKKQKYNWIAWFGYKIISVLAGIGSLVYFSILGYPAMISFVFALIFVALISEIFPLKDFKIKQLKNAK